MSLAYSTIWTELRATIGATFPEVVENAIARASTIQKIDFSRITPPYVVIVMEDAEVRDECAGDMDCYRIPVQFIYFRQDGSGVGAALEAKLLALRTAIYAAHFQYSQVYEVGRMEVSNKSEINRLLAEFQHDYTAGTLEAELWVSESR